MKRMYADINLNRWHAVQWTGDNFAEVSEYLLEHYVAPQNKLCLELDLDEWFCRTERARTINSLRTKINDIVVDERRIELNDWLIARWGCLFSYSDEDFKKSFSEVSYKIPPPPPNTGSIIKKGP